MRDAVRGNFCHFSAFSATELFAVLYYRPVAGVCFDRKVVRRVWDCTQECQRKKGRVSRQHTNAGQTLAEGKREREPEILDPELLEPREGKHGSGGSSSRRSIF